MTWMRTEQTFSIWTFLPRHFGQGASTVVDMSDIEEIAVLRKLGHDGEVNRFSRVGKQIQWLTS